MNKNLSREELISQYLFPKLKSFILKSTGLHYYFDKDNDLAERLLKRLSSLRLEDCADYLERLDGADGPRELDLLVAELTIGETYFFRHSEQFDGLREIIIPDILARNRATRRLRIWSAGCASGAEPYSVSILLKTHFSEQLRNWDVRIFGTDINKSFLEKARDGRYDEWAFRGTADSLKRDCFVQMGKQWAVAPRFKEGVSFQHHNLISDAFPPFGSDAAQFDLILCRNVVIYFSPDDFRKLVTQFEGCLGDGGWLVVGHSEPNTEFFRSFCIVSMPGAVLYQKNIAQGVAWQGFTPVVPESAKANSDLIPSPVSTIPDFKKSAEILAKPPAVAASPTASFDAVRDLADRAEWEQAAAACALLLTQDNLNSSVHCYYALILEHLGRDAEAEKALRTAVYLDRNSVLAHYYLGMRQRKNRAFALAARSFANASKLLARLQPDTVFSHADGISAVELQQLVRFQMEALAACEKRSTGAR